MIVTSNGQLLSNEEVYSLHMCKQLYIQLGQDDYEFNKMLVHQGKAKTYADAAHLTRKIKELFKSL